MWEYDSDDLEQYEEEQEEATTEPADNDNKEEETPEPVQGTVQSLTAPEDAEVKGITPNAKNVRPRTSRTLEQCGIRFWTSDDTAAKVIDNSR